jgi:hypothetical protein
MGLKRRLQHKNRKYPDQKLREDARRNALFKIGE